jgi:hypothetical protein
MSRVSFWPPQKFTHSFFVDLPFAPGLELIIVFRSSDDLRVAICDTGFCDVGTPVQKQKAFLDVSQAR